MSMLLITFTYIYTTLLYSFISLVKLIKTFLKSIKYYTLSICILVYKKKIFGVYGLLVEGPEIEN